MPHRRRETLSASRARASCEDTAAVELTLVSETRRPLAYLRAEHHYRAGLMKKSCRCMQLSTKARKARKGAADGTARAEARTVPMYKRT